tara:strand:- start:46 stop:513 length:468 start_codon:yes stop_codon:yes gene_type:complete
MTKDDCESMDYSWTFDGNISEYDCCQAYPTDIYPYEVDIESNELVSNPDGICDAWFNGGIQAIQLYIESENMDIVDLSDGSYFVGSDMDCDGDGMYDPGCNVIMGVGEDDFIPAGYDQLLFSANFVDNTGNEVCFSGTEGLINATWSPAEIIAND